MQKTLTYQQFLEQKCTEAAGGGYNLKPNLWLSNIQVYGDGYIIKFSRDRENFVCNTDELAAIIDILDRCGRKSPLAKIAIDKIRALFPDARPQDDESQAKTEENPLLGLSDKDLSQLRIGKTTNKKGSKYTLNTNVTIFALNDDIKEFAAKIIELFEGLPDDKKSEVKLKIPVDILSLLAVQGIKESTLQSLKQIGIRVIDSEGRSLNFEEDGVRPSPYARPAYMPLGEVFKR